MASVDPTYRPTPAGAVWETASIRRRGGLRAVVHMELLQTPTSRFEGVARFADHVVQVDGAGVHRVDEGEGDAVPLMHGEPTWSHLHRTMIPPLVESGRRVLAGTRPAATLDRWA